MSEVDLSWEWIGEQYSSGWHGVRLLVLGESSHGTSASSPHVLVKSHIDGTGHWRATYTRFQKLLQGRLDNPSIEQRAEFWSHLAFTNFLNQPAALTARAGPPPDRLWGEAVPDFHSMLGRLEPRPDGIIAWGKTLWDNLEYNPGCQWGSPPRQCLQWDSSRGRGQIHWPGGPPIPAVMIAHPSTPSALSPKWTAVLDLFLKGIVS